MAIYFLEKLLSKSQLKKDAQESPSPIIYEDNHLLLVYKPRYVLSQPDGSSRPCIIDWYKDYIKVRDHKPGAVWLSAVQRLDYSVEGLILLAKTSKAASRLSKQIRERQAFDKKYLLITQLPLNTKEKEGCLNLFIQKKEGRRKALCFSSANSNSKESKLSYKELKRLTTGFTLYEVELETGRYHQIRASFAYFGSPLVMDGLYSNPPSSKEKPALFAYHIAFQHPVRDERLSFTLIPNRREAPWNLLNELNLELIKE